MFLDLLKMIGGFILGVGIALGIILIKEKIRSNTLNGKFDKYPTERVDTSKMITDKYKNNLSVKQVKRNTINGKYDKR